MGRLLKRIRKGTDNSQITLEDNTYNLAGELISSKDALNHETLYSEQQGTGTTKTTTFADGGARIEIRAGDGTLLEVSGTAIAPVKYEHGVEEDMQVVKEIKVGDGGVETEWTKTFTDMLGRNVKTVGANGAIQVNVYNVQGQLIKTVDPDNVTALFAYNAAGEQTASVVDIDRDGEIDWGGNDRITTAERIVLAAHGTTVRRMVTKQWAEDAVDAGTVVSTVDQSADGLKTWQTAFGRTTTSVTQRLGGGDKIVTATPPDGTYVVEQHSGGQLISTIRFGSNNNQVAATNFTYDAHGRLRTQADARTGTTTTTYDNGDQVASVSAPNPSGSGSPLVTVYDYDAMGRQTGVQLPDATWTYTVYDFRGNVTRNYGSQTYDVSYTFDSQNRMKTMTTTGQAGNAVTTWNYDPQTGRLLNKRYTDNKGPSYAHSLGGKLHTRTWARLVGSDPRVTTYGYNAAGELASVDYSDSTPDVTYTHDRLGRTASVTDAAGIRSFAYRPSDLQLAGETLASFDRVLTRKFDGLGRNAGFTLGTVATPASDHEVTYGYDAAGRLNSVADTGGTHNYTYIPNSSLRASLTSPYHTTLYTYEPDRDALLSVENKVGGTTISKHAYDVNVLGQRKNVVQTGMAFATSAFNLYNYNPTGEVTSAKRYEGTNVGDTTLPVPDYDFGYSYDPIGNRLTHSKPGNAIPTSYVSNTLNQYVSTTAPSQTFVHDADGNLISSGDCTYTWDGENRLVQAANSTTGVTVDFGYDYQNRRFRKTVTTSGTPTSHQVLHYDGWNLIATYDYQPSTSHLSLITVFIWGLDLSGTLQGAGGIGGLLGSNNVAGTFLGRKEYTLDGNGNVSQVVNAAGFIVAHYEYGPFGEPLRATGPMAEVNPFRFSTKYQDQETGLVYNDWRYYDIGTGRWLGRDPIEENGGLNIYGMVGNNPISNYDPFGLALPERLKCCKIKRIVDNYTSTRPRANEGRGYPVSPNGIWNHPTGRVWVGEMTVSCEDGNIFTASIQTGGMRKSTSAVRGPTSENPIGDDSTAPAGDFRISTTKPGKGFPLAVSGTGRSEVTKHYAAYVGSHGCPTLVNLSEWNTFVELMEKTRQERRPSVPIRIQYVTPEQPQGSRGNGRSDPPQIPIAIPVGLPIQ